MHEPRYSQNQSADSVLVDLITQKNRLEGAIDWTKSVITSIRGAGRQIAFTNVGPVTVDAKEVGIAFSLPSGSLQADVFALTLVCVPSEADLASMRQESALADQYVRILNLLNWNGRGIKVFDQWFVNDCNIWHNSEEETQIFLTKEVKAWLIYWFGRDAPLPVYRPRRSLEIESLGKRPR